jgi:hypothetical protein
MKKILIFLLFASFSVQAQFHLPLPGPYRNVNVTPGPIEYYKYNPSTRAPWTNTAAVLAGVPSAERFSGQTFIVGDPNLVYTFASAADVASGTLTLYLGGGTGWPLAGTGTTLGNVTITGTNDIFLVNNPFNGIHSSFKLATNTLGYTIWENSSSVTIGAVTESIKLGAGIQFTTTNTGSGQGFLFNNSSGHFELNCGLVQLGGLSAGPGGGDSEFLMYVSRTSDGSLAQNSKGVFTNRTQTYGAGFKQIFTPSSTTAGVNVGTGATDPSGGANGDLFYNTTSNQLKVYASGVWVALGSGSGSVSSVSGSGGSTGLTFTGGPITTSGTLTLGGTLGTGNGGTGLTALGTGVATWLGTPSWTNFNSAITGTAPFVKTTGTSTLSGSPQFVTTGSDFYIGSGSSYIGLLANQNVVISTPGFEVLAGSTSLQWGNFGFAINTSGSDFSLTTGAGRLLLTPPARLDTAAYVLGIKNSDNSVVKIKKSTISGSGAVSSITFSSPLTGGTITTTGTVGISDAAANGSTKGAATFESTDFNSSAGDISIDYTNGQKATGSVPGFLSQTDWTTFNGKQAALVSATNIKTINSTSLLGSGNIVVAGTSNSAANTELMMSDGTNATPSKVFVPTSGNVTLGTGVTGTVRTIASDGSGANVDLFLKAKSGTVYLGDGATGLGVQVNNILYVPTGEIFLSAAVTSKIHPFDNPTPSATGFDFQLTAGKGGSGNSNGGNLVLSGGAKQGSGTPGTVQFNQLALNGNGILALDNSGNSSFTSSYNVDLNTTTTTGGTITLDLNNQFQRMFVGSSTFATPKTMAVSNTTNVRVFDFHFEVTNIAATMTLPSGWLMSDANFGAHVWTPPATGKFEMTATYDGTNWKVKIAGPFI